VNLSRVRSGALLAACLAGLTSGAAAQSLSHPELVFTVGVGEATGGRLWTVNPQPAPSLLGTDTVALGRRLLQPSFVAAFGAQLYLSPHIGYTLEATFLGLATESQCTPLTSFSIDPVHANEQGCTAVQNKHTFTNAVALQGGFTARTTRGRGVQAYVRAVGGVALLGGSFVNAEGTILVPASIDSSGTGLAIRSFLEEEASSHTFTWVATVGGGLTMALGSSYNVRFEMSEVFIALPVPGGPGDALNDPHRLRPVAPVRWRTFHLPSLTLGLDVLLERRTVRRY
jgi:hypothetical protein